MSDDQAPILNIVGERVAPGPHRRDLLPVYQRWINDFATMRTLGLPPSPMTLEAETAWYDSMAQNTTERVFTVYEQESGRPIGNTGLHGVDHRNRTATFGLLIGEPWARGKGYGTEATQLVLDYAFTALGLHNVMLSVYAFNLAARRVYEKVGFRQIGSRRECRWMGGQLWDEIFMDCLASEFTSPVLAEIFVPDTPRA